MPYFQKSASSGTNAWRKRFFLKKAGTLFFRFGRKGGDNSLIFS